MTSTGFTGIRREIELCYFEYLICGEAREKVTKIFAKFREGFRVFRGPPVFESRL